MLGRALPQTRKKPSPFLTRSRRRHESRKASGGKKAGTNARFSSSRFSSVFLDISRLGIDGIEAGIVDVRLW